MLGAIAGDIIGSVYETSNLKKVKFHLFHPQAHFTDDTVLTIAIAESLLKGLPFTETIRLYALKYPQRGYSSRFKAWLQQEEQSAMDSPTNGAAMRVSPVGFAFEHLYEVLAEAKKSAEATHNHPEAVKGAQAIAVSVFMARQGASKAEIREYVQKMFGYDLNRSIKQIRPGYKMSADSRETVPEALIAFLDSNGYEHCIRLAISLGGDTDTLAAMAGAVAQAFYRSIPYEIIYFVKQKLDKDLWEVVEEFNESYGINL